MPIRIRGWDGSVAGDPDAAATVVFVRRRGLRRLLWAPGELGLVRAYVSEDVHLEGDIFALLDLPDVIDRVAHHQGIGLSWRQRLAAAVSAVRIGAVGPPPRPPAEEVRRRRGRLHSISRDAQSVSHHYDVGNEFYRLILGSSMVYSCAYWAQEAGPAYGLAVDRGDRVADAGIGDRGDCPSRRRVHHVEAAIACGLNGLSSDVEVGREVAEGVGGLVAHGR